MAALAATSSRGLTLACDGAHRLSYLHRHDPDGQQLEAHYQYNGLSRRILKQVRQNGQEQGETDQPICFQGQYHDEESGLYYNRYHYYAAELGRYVTQDPIGLEGGLNTYRYGDANPIGKADPLGLATFMYTAPLHALGGTGAKSGADIFGNPLYHQYLCVSTKDGYICGGQDQRSQEWYDPIHSPGKPSNDSFNENTCKEEEPDNTCIEQCLVTKFGEPRPSYGIPFGTDCQEWSDEALKECQNICRAK